MRAIFYAGLAMCGMMVAGCGSDTSPTATAPATEPSKTEALKQDLQKVGQDIKADAQAAASQAGPAWQQTKQETRDLIHQGAQKVADWTATQPAVTQPQ